MFKKLIISALIIGGAVAVVYKNNETEIRKKWHLHTLNRELKDVYSHSRYYEKMARHGLYIPESKWEELHEKANNIKAEIRFVSNIESI